MIHVEWHAGTLRWGEDYQGPYAPYAVAATVIRVGNTIHIYGMSGVPMKFLKDMKVFCEQHGITKVCYERIKGHTMVLTEIEYGHDGKWACKKVYI